MGSVMLPLALLSLALVSGVSSIEVTIPQRQYEHARGDNITLPCTFKPNTPNPQRYVITWSRKEPGKKDTQVAVQFSGSRTDYHETYEGRAKLDVNAASGTANLRLYNINKNDNRSFECAVQIPGDNDGTLAALTTLVVLVAPSVPICKAKGQSGHAIKVEAEYGQDIEMSCNSEEGTPTPTYGWERHDVTNKPVPQDPKTTVVGGVMNLFNITLETSGYYICTSRNKIRSATCNITLAAMQPSMLGSVGQTAGIAAGIVAALLILIIVIYCCCKKKKAKDEEYAMGAREDEYRDKEPTENGDRREVRDDDRDEQDPRDRRDYDDRRSDYDDRRSDYDDRRSDYTERRSDYDDRRSDYTERRDRYTDDDPRDRRYDDDYDRRDRRYEDDRDRRDRHYDDDYDDRPPVPNNKPPRRDYDD